MVLKKKVSVGDIFAISLQEKNFNYGQVIDKTRGYICYIIFDVTSSEHPCLQNLTSGAISFLAFTVDYGFEQRIKEGTWKVIGNKTIPKDIVLPQYKVATIKEGKMRYMVMRYDGTIVKPATQLEIDSLNEFESVTPAVIEGAIKAKYLGGKWEGIYDGLKYK